MNSKPAAVDCLPPEMICQIFKNLNLDDLISCKLVCKQWYLIITKLSIKLTELVVIRDDVDKEFQKERWYYSNEQVNDQDYSKLNSFLTQLNANILSNLKHLMINVTLPKSFNLNQLNSFKNLVQLEIGCILRDNDNLNLNLLNLEILFIGRNENCRISIDCHKLKILCYLNRGTYSWLKIENPETIKDFKGRLTGSELAKFRNLEYLRCVDDFEEIINKKTLINFENLKELHYDETVEELADQLGDSRQFRRMKSTLKHLLKSARKLTGPDFKFYCFGLHLTENNIDKFDFAWFDLDQLVVEIGTKFYMTHYKLLQDSLPFVWDVYYDELMDSVNEIPKDYFTKFDSIRTVHVSDSVDQAHFFWFLKNLNKLSELYLRNVNLNQSFYDQLPTICSLECFKLDQKERIELNFDFIGKFAELFLLGIGKELSLKSAKSLVKSFRSLKTLLCRQISFKIKKNDFKVERISKDCDRYDLTISDWHQYYSKEKLKKSNITLDEVISSLDEEVEFDLSTDEELKKSNVTLDKMIGIDQ